MVGNKIKIIVEKIYGVFYILNILVSPRKIIVQVLLTSLALVTTCDTWSVHSSNNEKHPSSILHRFTVLF